MEMGENNGAGLITQGGPASEQLQRADNCAALLALLWLHRMLPCEFQSRSPWRRSGTASEASARHANV